MSKAKKMVGKTFGRLIVVEHSGKTKSGLYKYKCVCECGKVVVVSGANLRNSMTRSCGCLRADIAHNKHSDPYEGLLKARYQNQFYRALRFNEPVLDYDVWKSLIVQHCAYCAAAPKRRERNLIVIATNGIDRVNNSRGYDVSNIVPCCHTCNRKKQGMDVFEFESKYFPNGFLGDFWSRTRRLC